MRPSRDWCLVQAAQLRGPRGILAPFTKVDRELLIEALEFAAEKSDVNALCPHTRCLVEDWEAGPGGAVAKLRCRCSDCGELFDASFKKRSLLRSWVEVLPTKTKKDHDG